MNDEREPKRGGPIPLGDVLQSFLREAGLDAGLRDSRIFRAWNDALGEPLARRTRPVRFRTGELTVEVQSAAHLHELANFTGEGYRLLANDLLGTETIRRVSFKLKA